VIVGDMLAGESAKLARVRRVTFPENDKGGNPLDGYWNLLSTKVVLKGGVIVSDQR